MGYNNLVYIFGGVDSPRRGTRLSTCAVSWGGPAHCIPANVAWQIAGGLLTVLLPWPSMYVLCPWTFWTRSPVTFWARSPMTFWTWSLPAFWAGSLWCFWTVSSSSYRLWFLSSRRARTRQDWFDLWWSAVPHSFDMPDVDLSAGWTLK